MKVCLKIEPGIEIIRVWSLNYVGPSTIPFFIETSILTPEKIPAREESPVPHTRHQASCNSLGLLQPLFLNFLQNLIQFESHMHPMRYYHQILFLNPKCKLMFIAKFELNVIK